MRTLSILVLGLTLAGVVEAQEAAFRPLFDGTTFDGWEGNRDLFRIEDGALVAGTLRERIAANAFLCTTHAYDDFELRLKARLFGPGDNAGIQFRSRRVPDHHEVSGYQADVGTVSRAWFYQVIGVEDPSPDDAAPAPVWGALYDETRRDRYLAWSLPDEVAPVLKPDDWNELVVRAAGPRIQIWINDLQTVDYTEHSHIPPSGVICLQIHGGQPAEAWHKDILLRDLSGGE
jgi:hypothetical protein